MSRKKRNTFLSLVDRGLYGHQQGPQRKQYKQPKQAKQKQWTHEPASADQIDVIAFEVFGGRYYCADGDTTEGDTISASDRTE